MYDYKCTRCGHVEIDVLVPMDVRYRYCPKCETTEELGGPLDAVRESRAFMTRVWISKAPFVIGDEIDVSIVNGLGTRSHPARFRSRAELAREAKRRGMTNQVEHYGTKGGDRSKNTQRWI